MLHVISEKLDKPFIAIPLDKDSPMVNVRFMADHAVIQEETLRIAPSDKAALMKAEFDFHTYLGNEIEVDFFDMQAAADEEQLLQVISVTDQKWVPGQETEAKRPVYHYSSKKGYLNDPNGLFFYKGTFHMFYQWNPYGLTSGNTCWGHSISRDGVHFIEQEPAVLADRTDGCIFSGSGIVDYQNTSGLKEGEEAPILLFYTSTGYRFPPMRYFDKNFDSFFWENDEGYTKQCMAYSVDGGKTFRKYENNPIIKQIVPLNRDPKVVWNAEENCWIMVLFLRDHSYQFFFSDNLLHWEEGEIFSVRDGAECPDLFSLPLPGNANEKKWVLWAAPENYCIGYFEDRKFVQETPWRRNQLITKEEYRTPRYAAQTFFGMPENNVYQIFFMPVRFEHAPYCHCMSLPLKLKLTEKEEGLFLSAFPCEETKLLRGEAHTFHHILEKGRLSVWDIYELSLCADFEAEDAGGSFHIASGGVSILYEHKTKTINCSGDIFLTKGSGSQFKLYIWKDHGSMELFTDDGLVHISVAIETQTADVGLEIKACENCKLSGEIWNLERGHEDRYENKPYHTKPISVASDCC